MKHNLTEMEKALVRLSQVIRGPGWDLETIETQLDGFWKEFKAHKKELRERIIWLEDQVNATPPCSELRVYEIKRILGETDK